MGISRRNFLGWLGAATCATTLFGQQSQAASNKHFEGYPNSLGVLHDITRCIGCRKCEEACNSVNTLPPPTTSFDDLTVLDKKRRTNALSLTVVNSFNPDANDSSVFVKSQCNHCLEPACASACFVKALKKTETGAVFYNESLCVGCRYCMIACPFNIPAYEYNSAFTPRVMKCTMCQPRIEKGLLPGCVESCPKEALTFGPRAQLIERARSRINKYPKRYIKHIYGENEMGGTSWLYLSDVPFKNIGMREDLGIQPAPNFTAGPLATVPIVVGLWPLLLTGIYAITKRKEQIALQEKENAITKTIEDANEEMQTKLAQLRDKMTKEKEAAINLEVKRALEEAEKKKENEEQSASSGSDEGITSEKTEEEK